MRTPPSPIPELFLSVHGLKPTTPEFMLFCAAPTA